MALPCWVLGHSHPNAASCAFPRPLVRTSGNQSDKCPPEVFRLPYLFSDLWFLPVKKVNLWHTWVTLISAQLQQTQVVWMGCGRQLSPRIQASQMKPNCDLIQKVGFYQLGCASHPGGKILTDLTIIPCGAAIINPWFSCQLLQMLFCR